MLARSLTTGAERRRAEEGGGGRRRALRSSVRPFFGGGSDVATCGMSSGRIVQLWGHSLRPSGPAAPCHCRRIEIGVVHEDGDVSLPGWTN